MDVSIAALGHELATWIRRARDGEDVVVTDRGVPVVRLVGVGSSTLLQELTRANVLSPPSANPQPDPRDLPRPTPRREVSDLVSEQRAGR